MALSVQAKTYWLLIIGAAIILIILAPIRFNPVALQTIDSLTLQTRGLLVQRYEPVARALSARADTLRKAITTRYGGTTPTQDSLLAELEDRADAMLQITAHLREPSKATFEEKRVDVGGLIQRLQNEADVLVRQMEGDYLGKSE